MKWWSDCPASHVSVGGCVSPQRGNKTDFSFVILQRKSQTQQVREFHTKSIKDKAVHLRGLFSANSAEILKVTISDYICDSTVCCALPAFYRMFMCTLKHAIFLHAACFPCLVIIFGCSRHMCVYDACSAGDDSVLERQRTNSHGKS